MTSISDIRQKYPQYSDLSDDQLADALHKKFYADMPADTFRQKIGLQAPTYGQKVSAAGSAFDKAAGTGLRGVGNTIAAAMDVGEHAVTGIAGDIAGAATSIATQDASRGEAIRKRVSDIGAPSSEAGKAAEGYVGAITAPLGRAMTAPQRYLEKHGHPIAAQTLTAAEDVMGARRALATREAAAVIPKTISEELRQQARAAGYVLKPSEAGGRVGAIAEGYTNSPKLSVEASVKNQKVTNSLAAEEIGLAPGKRITASTLKDAKAPHNAVYEEMGQLGDITTDGQYHRDIGSVGRAPGKSFKKAEGANSDVERLREDYAEDSFDSKDAVLKIRQLRADSVKNIKAPNAPKQNELGYAQRQVADAIERQMERHATAVGKPDLVERFRSARTELAKIHNVEAAKIGNTGDVSAKRLAKMLEKNVPLTGNLKTIAETAQEFGEVMRDGPSLKNKTAVTGLEGVGVAGSLLEATMNPHVGLPMLGVTAVRPLTRKFLLSDLYQNTLGPK
jgi:hypothetical protein